MHQACPVLCQVLPSSPSFLPYAVKKAQLEAAYKRQQQEISELKDFVARNKARVSTRNMAMSTGSLIITLYFLLEISNLQILTKFTGTGKRRDKP